MPPLAAEHIQAQGIRFFKSCSFLRREPFQYYKCDSLSSLMLSRHCGSWYLPFLGP